MKVGKVAGTVVSTVNIPLLDEHRLLLCDLQDVGGNATGYTIAVDVVDAGVGETVLIEHKAIVDELRSHGRWAGCWSPKVATTKSTMRAISSN